MLLLNVEDILGFAQIQNGRFVKVSKKFNIKNTVKDIMTIQMYQAKSKGIELVSKFFNFAAKGSAKSKYKKNYDVAKED